VRLSRTWLTSALVAAVTTVTVVTGPAALADRHDHAERPDLPSKAEVRAAEDAASQKARDVAAIKAQLVLANQRLEQAATRAEQASEAYNGAMWQLEKATDALRQAREEAARARAHVARQRDAIGALVASSYQQATDLNSLSAVMGADGPEGVLDQFVAFQGASSSMQADYQRFAAADSLAQVFEDTAADAAAEQRRVAARARAARAAAAAAADAAQATATATAEQKDRLIRELARAQDISVGLARKRQAALEEIARRRAEERARQEALAAARAQAREERQAQRAAARKAAEAAEAAAAAERQRAAARKARADKPSQPAPQPVPQPAPQPAPQPVAAPSPRGGVGAVLDFARAQVGEPYQWGAAGPDSWDCSGLTMGAWAAAGVSLPHYTVAQYYAGTPISAGELRPGDLVFWSSSSSPDGIHHVALYLGDGMIVHAPRTGRDVTVESMYYWVPPTHFSRI
jgi:cell wall-associated NlpC family hydrolase